MVPGERPESSNADTLVSTSWEGDGKPPSVSRSSRYLSTARPPSDAGGVHTTEICVADTTVSVIAAGAPGFPVEITGPITNVKGRGGVCAGVCFEKRGGGGSKKVRKQPTKKKHISNHFESRPKVATGLPMVDSQPRPSEDVAATV